MDGQRGPRAVGWQAHLAATAESAQRLLTAFATKLPPTYLFQSTPTETVDAKNPYKPSLTCINRFYSNRPEQNYKTALQWRHASVPKQYVMEIACIDD
jgi:hypothetical protein